MNITYKKFIIYYCKFKNLSITLFPNVFKFSIIKIIAIFQILLVIIINYNILKKNKYKLEEDLKQSNQTIVINLSETFQQTTQFLTYIGKQILKGNYKNSNFILTILQDVSLDNYNMIANAFSWSFIDWVNKEGFQTINQKQGVRETPIDMKSRSYTIDCKKDPWKLYFSSPTFGFPSKILVIPAGIGITDENNEFIGILVVGFNIDEISRNLKNKISPNINFQIFKNNELIFSSDLKKNISSISENFYLSSYIYNSPYIVYSYYKKKDFYLKHTKLFIISLLINFIILIILWLSFNYIKKSTIIISKKADLEAKKLTSEINNRLITRTNTIKRAGKILLDNLNQKNTYKLSDNSLLSLTSAIYDAAVQLWEIPLDRNNFKLINLNKLIEDSLTIKSKIILEKRINTKLNLQIDIPNIYLDELYTKLVIIGFLSYAIDGIPLKSKLEVSSSIEIKENKKFILIKIIDSGFGISLEDRERINSKIIVENQIDYLNTPLKYLLKLSDLIGCKCSFTTLINVGTTINLIFPIVKVGKNNRKKIISLKKDSNIVYLIPR